MAQPMCSLQNSILLRHTSQNCAIANAIMFAFCCQNCTNACVTKHAVCCQNCTNACVTKHAGCCQNCTSTYATMHVACFQNCCSAACKAGEVREAPTHFFHTYLPFLPKPLNIICMSLKHATSPTFTRLLVEN